MLTRQGYITTSDFLSIAEMLFTGPDDSSEQTYHASDIPSTAETTNRQVLSKSIAQLPRMPDSPKSALQSANCHNTPRKRPPEHKLYHSPEKRSPKHQLSDSPQKALSRAQITKNLKITSVMWQTEHTGEKSALHSSSGTLLKCSPPCLRTHAADAGIHNDHASPYIAAML